MLERFNLLAAGFALRRLLSKRRPDVVTLLCFRAMLTICAEVAPADCARKQFETLCDPANSAPAIGSPLIIE
jgi:hypothetical protein